MFRSNIQLRARLLREGGGDGGPGAGGGGAPSSEGGQGGAPATGGNPEDQLGDAGKKALDERKRERDEQKARADKLEAELERLRNASKSEQEKALDKARQEGRTEAISAANARLVALEVKAAAAHAGFNDSGDAVVQLRDKLADIKVDDNGQVDEKAVKDAVEQLAKDKPYLVKQAGTAPPSDAGIGAGGRPAGGPEPTPGLGRLTAAYGASSRK